MERGGLADRSLDRVKAANFFMGQGKELILSRQELLKNEYRKVIENYPSTLINAHENYDDTDYLQRMFAKEKEQQLNSILEINSNILRSESTNQLPSTKNAHIRSDSIESGGLRNNLARGGSKDASGKNQYQSSGEGRNHMTSNTELQEAKRREYAEFKPTTMFSLLGDKMQSTGNE